MMLKKLIVAVCALFPLGLIGAGGGVILARQPAQVRSRANSFPPRNSPGARAKNAP